MKKLASLVGAGALLLGMAAPVLAGVTVINKGWASQTTTATATADTGGNDFKAWKGGSVSVGGSADTGDALAGSLATSTANQYKTKVVTDCGCDVFVKNKGGAKQTTTADATANTGGNDFKAWKGGSVSVGGSADTGDAVSYAEAGSWANIFKTKVISFGL